MIVFAARRVYDCLESPYSVTSRDMYQMRPTIREVTAKLAARGKVKLATPSGNRDAVGNTALWPPAFPGIASSIAIVLAMSAVQTTSILVLVRER